MGPVLDQHKSVAARMVEEGLLETVQGCEFEGQARPTEVYRALAAPDCSVFSDAEMFILERVARKCLPLNGAAPEELSQREAPWVGVEAYDRIPYELASCRGTDFSDEAQAA